MLQNYNNVNFSFQHCQPILRCLLCLYEENVSGPVDGRSHVVSCTFVPIVGFTRHVIVACSPISWEPIRRGCCGRGHARGKSCTMRKLNVSPVGWICARCLGLIAPAVRRRRMWGVHVMSIIPIQQNLPAQPKNVNYGDDEHECSGGSARDQRDAYFATPSPGLVVSSYLTKHVFPEVPSPDRLSA